MRKILIVGGDGFLGSNLLWYAKEKHEVVATTRSFPFNVEGCKVELLDIAEKDRCVQIMRKHDPDLVINTVAVVGLDVAEKDRDLTRQVHVQGTKNLVDACKQPGAEIVYISTDYVFDGTKIGGTYDESDQPSPINYYGATKLEAEGIVRDSGLDWIIGRPAHLYGPNFATPFVEDVLRQTHAQKRCSYPETLLNMLRGGQAIALPTELYQTPVLASDFSQALLSLIDLGARGIYNICGPDCVSRYRFYSELARTFGADSGLVTATSVEEYARLLNVPANILPRRVCMNASKVEGIVGRKMLGIRDGLALFRSQLDAGERRVG